MIAVCASCGKMFDTTEEDAPGVCCPACHLAGNDIPICPHEWKDFGTGETRIIACQLCGEEKGEA